MNKTALVVIAAALFTTPLHAAEWNEMRPGTFIGARLTIDGKTGGRPVAAITIAPAQHRLSNNGMASMRIGEGIAFNFTPHAKPTLTLAGVRADTVLGLNRDDDHGSDKKGGMSTGAWIAIGVVAVVGAGALWYNDYCNDNEATLCGDEE